MNDVLHIEIITAYNSNELLFMKTKYCIFKYLYKIRIKPMENTLSVHILIFETTNQSHIHSHNSKKPIVINMNLTASSFNELKNPLIN